MKRQEAWEAKQAGIARLLQEHLQHRGFEPYDCDRDRTIGWRCACGGDGSQVEVPTSWYNAVARHSVPAWGEYENVRSAHARRWSEQAARHMRRRYEERLRPSAEELAAEEKAKELLYRFISKKQREQLEGLGYFEQVGGDGQVYRLWAGAHRSIELVENNAVTKTLCIHPKITVPASDTLLAQKLLVQGDITRLYKTANVRPRRR